MACPTCSHTMSMVVSEVFWCPRCGTLKHVGGSWRKGFDVPKLVDRCRELRDTLGISESINLPEDR